MDRSRDKEQTITNGQERFILRIRECAAKLSNLQKREEVLSECARLFADFTNAADVIIIDLSRANLDLYRSNDDGRDTETPTVVMEESVGPILELLQDRYLDELGIKILKQRIANPLEGIETDELSDALELLGMNNGFILPLTIARSFGVENVQGLILITKVPTYRFEDAGHFALLRMAADLLSVTADNRDLGNALARLRPTDSVTGLASRSKLTSLLSQEVYRASFLNRSFALILGDIDNFKSLNDRQGFRYGDLVVKTVAEDLLSEARPIDTVCRWGGEEYLILMPETSRNEALEFAERCRKVIGEHPITPNDYLEEVFVSMSFGVVLYPDHGPNADILLRNVELALLQSKLNGRNQSVMWSEEWLKAESG